MTKDIPTLSRLSDHIIAVANNVGQSITNLQLQKVLYFAFKYAIKQSNQNDMFKKQDLKHVYKNSHPFVISDYGPVVPTLYWKYHVYGASPIKSFTRPCMYFNHPYFNSEIMGLLRINPFKLVHKARHETFWQIHSKHHGYPYSFNDLLN